MELRLHTMVHHNSHRASPSGHHGRTSLSLSAVMEGSGRIPKGPCDHVNMKTTRKEFYIAFFCFLETSFLLSLLHDYITKILVHSS